MLSVSGRLLDQDDVRAALARRWRRISGPAFLDARLSLCTGEVEEADLLVDLIDAAVGRAAGETLARRLTTVLAGRAFEQEVRFSPDPAPVCLKRLASLADRIDTLSLRPETRAEAEGRLARLMTTIKADAAALTV
jgi:hypothetical protein